MNKIIKTLLIAVLLTIVSCKDSKPQELKTETINPLEKSQIKNEIKFNGEEELSKINNYIVGNLTDSVSNNNYKCWLRNGKIIKLNIVDGDEENYVIEEDYYFKDNNAVFAYQKKELNFPNAIDYKALIYFDNIKTTKEDYWIRDAKTTKDSIENQLNRIGLTIQNEIILDKESNKPKGFLTLLDLSKRYNFNYQTGHENGNSGNKTIEYENTKTSKALERKYDVGSESSRTNSTNEGGYKKGNDGRLYEQNKCSLCKGTGIETGRNVATGKTEGRICPMCEGRGVRSY